MTPTTSRPPALMQTYKRWPVRFSSGRGATLFDPSGRSYVDMTAGIAVASLGHGHPELAAAIADQASRLVHVSNLYETAPAERLADRLFELTGCSSFFCNSGAEAVECAIKLARRWAASGDRPGRTIIAMEEGFHGRTLGALAATGQPSKRAAFEPMVPAFKHVPFGDIRALEMNLTSDVIAVLLEPIQGEAGVRVPPAAYLEEVRSLCDRHGVLLVLDEVQTGVGRTGRWFAHEWSSASPDVMCLAKGLAGGLPIGACVARPEVAERFEPGDHGSTFGGGPVPCAAALVVLDVIEREGLLKRVVELGARLASSLADIFGTEAEVRGRGLLIGVDLGAPVARTVAAAALERGLLVNDATPTVLRFTPPLVVSDQELERGLGILEEAWHATR